MRSARKHALALRMSNTTVCRILHFDLNFHPYKMVCVHELLEQDYVSRVNCCSQIFSQVPEDSVLLTSDEAHFHLSGIVNKQNFRYQSNENPQQTQQQPLHSKRVTSKQNSFTSVNNMKLAYPRQTQNSAIKCEYKLITDLFY